MKHGIGEKGKNSERRASFSTASGLEAKPVYVAADAKRGDAVRSDIGYPGEYPFTRGIHSSMYRGRLWTMRQYAGFGTAAEANQRYHFLLKQGTTGLSVAFDLPTQMGRDSDHPSARGEVGKVGVAIASVDDMDRLLAGLPLDQISISMTINATAAILLSFMLVVAERRGVPWTALRGTIQNDILKEYIARGTYIYPPRPALRIVTDIFSFCQREVPNWNTISISGYHIREAGSTAVEELAFTLADAVTYVDAALGAGLKIDEFAPRLAFFFNCHNDFLEEIAKFRAARRLWATIMRERFGARKAESLMLRFHTQTAGSSLTAQQPINNVVRTTLQALAAVLGGTQSLHTNSFDEALGLPTDESATLALRTQQVIAQESGVADVIDPLGGSYLIEAWTDRLEHEAKSLMERIDQRGGMLAAIEGGLPQEMIERSAFAYQRAIESGERSVIGVNCFADSVERQIPIHRMNPQGEEEQRRRLKDYRTARDAAAHGVALDGLVTAARGKENLLTAILSAARAGATLGEISDALRGVFGEFSAPSIMAPN